MDSLLALSRAETEEAKRFFQLRIYAHVAALVIGIPALFVSGTAAYVLALAALVSEAVAWTLRRIGSQRQEQGEKGRRRALLMDAYGDTQEPIDVGDLRHDFSQRAEQTAAKHGDPSYWSTTAPVGPQRLVGQLQESAFWSKHLYRVAATGATKIGVALGTLVVAILLAAALVESNGARLAVARIVVVFMAFLITVDVLTRALAWRSAAAQAGEVDRRLERCEPDTSEAVLAIWGDYSVATATAPPIPTPVYLRHKDRLEREWAARQGRSSG
jgi:hypothetical protein